jgi:hypothetical protein
MSYFNEICNGRGGGTPALNLGHVEAIKRWLLTGGISSKLVMQRIENRNVLWLELSLPEGMVTLAVTTLNGLHRKKIKREHILSTVLELVHEVA